MTAVLEEKHKKAIQKAYSMFLEKKSLKARSGQKQMIAELARELGKIQKDDKGVRVSAPSVTVIEAGTGTGKTVAYSIPSIVMAQASRKTVVISTATVTLQEQIISKDLPDILNNTGMTFSFTLAKGRGRYACLSKLDRLLQEEKATASLASLFAEEGFSLEQDSTDRALYQNMLEKFAASQWQGDRDSWPDALDDNQWRIITTDHAQCSGRHCSYFSQCPFYNARADLERADIIVTNHDLVMADLVLGGGAILPAPKNCVYIFDEGHHLPDKAINHFACHSRLKATASWLDKAGKYLQKVLAQHEPSNDIAKRLQQIQPEFEALITQLNHTRQLLHSIAHFEPRVQGNAQVAIYRLPNGIVPDVVIDQANLLKTGFSKAGNLLEKVSKLLNDAMDGDVPGIERWQAEQLFPEIGSIVVRLQNQFQLWQSYTERDATDKPPCGRWLKWSENAFGEELEVFSSPILSASTLNERLWAPCYAAIVTSATLSALGHFDRYRMRSGIPIESRCVIVPSPFEHDRAALLVVPAMDTDPRETQEHTNVLIERIPELINQQQGTLVLFSSRRQMNDVYEGLSVELQDSILLQDDYSRQQLLKLHRKHIDQGDSSTLFGLASLTEGIDLPGSYCEHVIIARIPFAVPDNPVEAALAEWLEAQGGNPFMEITVPDAAIRLVQACGRLLRTEQDTGQITLLDRRVVTKRYGKIILDSLPPFSRKIERH
ncbi:MAG: ATP-dependent DNA helicase DinG [Endozoicomonas sp. (ex Botrylloides leachii)]|nr:ATP-dependent DNA helicase DinG [Endozoicomonas sp. (ex Botrylloides leachii)]